MAEGEDPSMPPPLPSAPDTRPALRMLNPHEHTTKSTSLPTAPHAGHIPFTDAIMRHPVIPHYRLTGNIHPSVIAAIASNPPDLFTLAVVPYGGGKHFQKQHPNFPREVEKFLTSFTFPCEEGLIEETPRHIQVHAPREKGQASLGSYTEHREFSQPWIYILELNDKSLKDFLLHHEIFAVRPDLTFMVYAFDHHEDTWALMNIKGPMVKDDSTYANVVLQTIKSTIRADPVSATCAQDSLSRHHLQGTCADRITFILDSMQLYYVDTTDKNGEPDPYYVLTAQPISTEEDLQRRWSQRLRLLVYHGRYDYLKISDTKRCNWCKSDLHIGYLCPLPQTSGWLGTIPPDIKEHQDTIKRNVALKHRKEVEGEGYTQVETRTSGRGRQRGSRGASRGSPRGRGGRGRGRAGSGRYNDNMTLPY